MNKLTLITIALTTLIFSSFDVTYDSIITEDSEYFKIEVVQDGKVVEERDGTINLKKKPFEYHLTMYKVDGIDVSNSWGKYYYDYPEDQNIYECNDISFFKDCRFVAVKTGNEDKFNVNKDIYVGDGNYQGNWFYKENLDWHRLDREVYVRNGVIYAKVTVENIFDLDKRDERNFEEEEYNYPIEKIDQDIYAVFAVSHYESGMKMPQELQREKFVLHFE